VGVSGQRPDRVSMQASIRVISAYIDIELIATENVPLKADGSTSKARQGKLARLKDNPTNTMLVSETLVLVDFFIFMIYVDYFGLLLACSCG
jgi:hypothetical protein